MTLPLNVALTFLELWTDCVALGQALGKDKNGVSLSHKRGFIFSFLVFQYFPDQLPRLTSIHNSFYEVSLRLRVCCCHSIIRRILGYR